MTPDQLRKIASDLLELSGRIEVTDPADYFARNVANNYKRAALHLLGGARSLAHHLDEGSLILRRGERA
ncbi:hypothetical protein ACFPTX_16080 [Pseudomonas sp. GCM10022188]|uniref:hypothetical protein n=1 Tax=Pseudomonas TaxID=286 RepID=UPI001E2E379C|nr:hypothetical protein [Pseudomonas oryzagri]MCC6076043.1 hypothetical protein [Pseudomonas oryzagri]